MTQTQKTEFFNLRPAEKINEDISDLPIAKEARILRADTGKEIENKKAVIVDDTVVNIPTDRYGLVQHKEAFRPIINGLVRSGVQDFQYTMWATKSRANMNILVGEAKDGVKYGFRVFNSVDGTSSLRFGYKAFRKSESVVLVEKKHVTLWGYRQTCSNGMVAKVPLEYVKYMDAETRTKIENLVSGMKSIVHVGKMEDKIKEMQFMTEAMMLLKDPLNRMIIDAQNYSITNEQAEAVLEKWVGKRKRDLYMSKYQEEADSLWGLYNAMTWMASHNEKFSTGHREVVLDRAGTMLTEELIKAEV